MLDFNLINTVLDSMISSFLTHVGEAMGQRLLKGKQTLADGGTPEQRFAAYERLRRSCVELRTVLDVLWSLPTHFAGTIVSLPIQYRLLHRVPSLGAAVNDAFLGVAVVGRRDVLEATQALAEALQDAVQQQQHGRLGPLHSQQRIPRTDWSAFDEALVSFVATCRSDLGIQALEKR